MNLFYSVGFCIVSFEPLLSEDSLFIRKILLVKRSLHLSQSLFLWNVYQLILPADPLRISLNLFPIKKLFHHIKNPVILSLFPSNTLSFESLPSVFLGQCSNSSHLPYVLLTYLNLSTFLSVVSRVTVNIWSIQWQSWPIADLWPSLLKPLYLHWA